MTKKKKKRERITQRVNKKKKWTVYFPYVLDILCLRRLWLTAAYSGQVRLHLKFRSFPQVLLVHDHCAPRLCSGKESRVERSEGLSRGSLDECQGLPGLKHPPTEELPSLGDSDGFVSRGVGASRASAVSLCCKPGMYRMLQVSASSEHL